MLTLVGKLKVGIVLMLMTATTFFHYFTVLTGHYYYIFYREMYFFPLVLAGFWFGLRGALATSIAITMAYLPLTVMYWNHFSTDDLTRVVEIILYNAIAIVMGVLKDREQQQHEELIKAESLAAMGKAVSSAAHDLKTPLIAIGGFANLVMSRLGKVVDNPQKAPEVIEDAQAKLAIVVKETARLEKMVRQMLDFSRPLELRKSEQKIIEIIEESVALVESSAKAREVEIILEATHNLPSTSLDPERFKQVLVNLLMNAVQASPQGERVSVRSFVNGEKLVVEVTDCGCGIPVEKRSEMFNPFFTTKKDGTGLGLPIVKKIVEAHGGQVEILDNRPQGLTFRIIIPMG